MTAKIAWATLSPNARPNDTIISDRFLTSIDGIFIASPTSVLIADKRGRYGETHSN